MNKYHPRMIRRIEDALDTPTDMLIRVTAPLHGVWAELQPEIGKVYPAVRGRLPEGYKHRNRRTKPFCYIRVKDHIIVLRRGHADVLDEYEEVMVGG